MFKFSKFVCRHDDAEEATNKEGGDQANQWKTAITITTDITCLTIFLNHVVTFNVAHLVIKKLKGSN